MAHPLRDRGTPRALAESRQVIDFKGNLSDFERLSGIVEADLQTLAEADRPAHWRRAQVQVGLEFCFADVKEAVPVVTGSASVTLDAVCQRCLERFALPLEVTMRYLLLPAGERAEAYDGYDDYDVWELAEERLVPQDLVEEALIMALPLSAAHRTVEECGPLASRVDDEQGSPETVRPFAGLKAQLKGND